MTDHTQTAECPDCTAVAKSNHLLHEATCPLGLAMDRVSAVDAEWFERHPTRQRVPAPRHRQRESESKPASPATTTNS
jgi:hypothetical protein